MVGQLNVKTSPNAIPINNPNRLTASSLLINPETNGLFLVRSTFESTFISAISLITQPALRITKTPKLNTINKNRLGQPSLAIHNAQYVGHNNK